MNKRLIVGVVIMGIMMGLVIGALYGYFYGRKQEICIPVLTKKSVAISLDHKDQKYLNGTREHITFSVPESATSHKTITRQGVLVKRKGARATLLIVHGFMCDKHDVDFLSLLLGEYVFQPKNQDDIRQPALLDVYRYNTFTIDLRAHGENNQGQCCTFGRDEALDVLAAARYLKTRSDLNTVPLGVYGFSMGAVSSILAQAQDPIFDFGISDCPFDSTENIIGRGLEHLKIVVWGYEFPVPGRSLLHRYAYNSYVQSFLKFILKTVSKMDSGQVATCIVPVNTVEKAKYLTKPWFFITCKKDEKAPVEAVKKVYDQVQGFKRLLITDGRHHFDSLFYNPARYQYKVHNFMRKILNDTYKAKVTQKIEVDNEQSIKDIGA